MNRKEKQERTRLRIREIKKSFIKAGIAALAKKILKGGSDQETMVTGQEAYEKAVHQWAKSLSPQENCLAKRVLIDIKTNGFEDVYKEAYQEVVKKVLEEGPDAL